MVLFKPGYLIRELIYGCARGAAGRSQYRGCGAPEHGFDGATGDIQNIFRLELDVHFLTLEHLIQFYTVP